MTTEAERSRPGEYWHDRCIDCGLPFGGRKHDRSCVLCESLHPSVMSEPSANDGLTAWRDRALAAEARVKQLKADAELLDWLDSRPRYSIIRNLWADGSNAVAISGLLDLSGARDDELYGPDVRSALRMAMEAARRE